MSIRDKEELAQSLAIDCLYSLDTLLEAFNANMEFSLEYAEQRFPEKVEQLRREFLEVKNKLNVLGWKNG